MHVTALLVAIGWLYWKSAGSLFVAMLMHASINNTAGPIPAALPSPVPVGSLQGSFMAWATAVAAWVVAVVLLYQIRGARFETMMEASRE